MHASIGIDLGKTTFHLVALGERNKILVRKKFSRAPLLTYTANLPASLIGPEACAGAHFLGAALRAQGHQVRLGRIHFRRLLLVQPNSCCIRAATIHVSTVRRIRPTSADPGLEECLSLKLKNRENALTRFHRPDWKVRAGCVL